MDKREHLYQLIVESEDNQQIKINKIINILQLTDDIMKAKILSQKVINGDLEDIKEETVDNLIAAFEGELKISKNSSIEIKHNINDSAKLKKELEELKKQLEQNKIVINEIKKENNILKELSKVSNHFVLIESPEEDINELYIKYMKSGITTHNKAFVVDRKLVKSYYQL